MKPFLYKISVEVGSPFFTWLPYKWYSKYMGQFHVGWLGFGATAYWKYKE